MSEWLVESPPRQCLNFNRLLHIYQVAFQQLIRKQGICEQQYPEWYHCVKLFVGLLAHNYSLGFSGRIRQARLVRDKTNHHHNCIGSSRAKVMYLLLKQGSRRINWRISKEILFFIHFSFRKIVFPSENFISFDFSLSFISHFFRSDYAGCNFFLFRIFS